MKILAFAMTIIGKVIGILLLTGVVNKVLNIIKVPDDNIKEIETIFAIGLSIIVFLI